MIRVPAVTCDPTTGLPVGYTPRPGDKVVGDKAGEWVRVDPTCLHGRPSDALDEFAVAHAVGLPVVLFTCAADPDVRGPRRYGYATPTFGVTATPDATTREQVEAALNHVTAAHAVIDDQLTVGSDGDGALNVPFEEGALTVVVPPVRMYAEHVRTCITTRPLRDADAQTHTDVDQWCLDRLAPQPDIDHDAPPVVVPTGMRLADWQCDTAGRLRLTRWAEPVMASPDAALASLAYALVDAGRADILRPVLDGVGDEDAFTWMLSVIAADHVARTARAQGADQAAELIHALNDTDLLN